MPGSQFVEQLSEPYRTSVHLHCLEHWSYTRIAQHLQCTKGTVKSHVNRGKKKLQELVKRSSGDTEAPELMPQEEKSALIENIEKLSQPYCQVMRLHYIDKKTYREIAELLTIPKGTVKSYVSRGQKRLARLA